MSGSERIAILGGTFDPIHRGHVDPVVAIADRFGWGRILVVPAHRQPFKPDVAITSDYHRFAMAVLACEGDARFVVSPIELERGRVSYTVETLTALRETTDAPLEWIVGDDQLAALDRWRELDRIFELANFIVLARGGSPDDLPRAFHSRVTEARGRSRAGSIVFAENQVVPISATAIREGLREGRDVSGLLHPRVAEYIRKAGLYRGEMAG